MKKKLYVLSMVTILSLTCIGCGNKDVAENTEATTEAAEQVTTEEVTEEATTEKATEKTTRETTEEKTTEKKTDDKKSEEKKTDNKTVDKKKTDTKKATTTGGASGTVAGNTQSNNTTSSSGQTNNNTQSSTPSTPAPQPAKQTTECQHNWVEQTETVHHDAVYEEVIKEPADVYYWHCGITGNWYHSYADDPCGSGAGSSGCYVARPAVREVICKQGAYDEQVGTGMYQCSKCGVMK